MTKREFFNLRVGSLVLDRWDDIYLILENVKDEKLVAHRIRDKKIDNIPLNSDWTQKTKPWKFAKFY